MITYFFKLKFYLGWVTAIKVLLDKRIKKGAIKVPLVEYPFYIRHTDFADNQVFNEVILKRAYASIDPNKEKVVRILDLGANIGLSAISFLSEYPNVALCVVEPDTGNYKLLLKNLKPFMKQGRDVHCYNTAVYSRETQLFMEDPGVGSHGFRAVEGKISTGTVGLRSVSVNGLLAALKWDRVDIIKIDIEGAEKELFEENVEWIDRTRYLIVETHDRFKKNATKTVFNALSSKQYEMKIWNQNLLFVLDK